MPTAAFLAGLIHTVAVDLDHGAAGAAGTTDLHGTPRKDPRPVPGLGSVACRCVADVKPKEVDVDGRKHTVLAWTVLLGAPLDVGVGHVLKFTDPDLGGRVRYLNPVGPPVNEHQMGNHWVLTATEKIA